MFFSAQQQFWMIQEKTQIEKRHMVFVSCQNGFSGLDENQMSISEARNQEKKDSPMTSNLSQALQMWLQNPPKCLKPTSSLTDSSMTWKLNNWFCDKWTATEPFLFNYSEANGILSLNHNTSKLSLQWLDIRNGPKISILKLVKTTLYCFTLPTLTSGSISFIFRQLMRFHITIFPWMWWNEQRNCNVRIHFN